MSNSPKSPKPYGSPRLWESAVAPLLVVPFVIGGSLLLIALVRKLLLLVGFPG